MEFVVGETLEQHMAARQTDLRQACGWGAALARALAYAHEQGIVHGDIKPANVMINADGRVMLTDFGIARFATHISQNSGLSGTPAYLAPEQIEGGPIDGRSDLFSLGIVLYQLVTGQRPFQADSVKAVCAQILKAKVTPPTKVNPALPPGFDTIIARCLAKNPQHRYANGELLSAALESVAREPVATPRHQAARNRSISMVVRYAGAAALVLVAVSLPIAARFYKHNLQLPPAPVTMHPAPKPPDELPFWRGMQDTSAPSAQMAAAPEPLVPHPPSRARPVRTKKRPTAPAQSAMVAEASAEAAATPAPAKQPPPTSRAAGIPMTIEISAQSSDGTLAVFADHQLVFSTPLASVSEAAGEPLRAVRTLLAGQHQLSVALYKADRSLRAEKQGWAELHHGDTNVLAIRVVKKSKILVLRGTGLEVTWPARSADHQADHQAKPGHAPKVFSAEAAALALEP
jgi:hypothetical protein